MSDKKNKQEGIVLGVGSFLFIGGITYTLFHYIPDMSWIPVISITGGFLLVLIGLRNKDWLIYTNPSPQTQYQHLNTLKQQYDFIKNTNQSLTIYNNNWYYILSL